MILSTHIITFIINHNQLTCCMLEQSIIGNYDWNIIYHKYDYDDQLMNDDQYEYEYEWNEMRNIKQINDIINTHHHILITTFIINHNQLTRCMLEQSIIGNYDWNIIHHKYDYDDQLMNDDQYEYEYEWNEMRNINQINDIINTYHHIFIITFIINHNQLTHCMLEHQSLWIMIEISPIANVI